MKTRILVVDDEPEICFILKEVLSGEGFEVLTAQSADEFRILALGKIPHLIILDINLGGSSGPEVYKELLFKGLNAATPVIFLSALVPEELNSSCPMTHGRKYTMHAKPFSHDKLIAEIRKFTETPNAEAA